MASLENMAARLPGQVDVVMLSHPDNWDRDRDAARRHNITLRLATLAPGTDYWTRSAAFEERDRTYTVPRSLVYRRDGKGIVLAQRGSEQWDSAANLRRLRSFLPA